MADLRFIDAFDFRVLRQNRRVITGNEDRKAELDDFHEVLSDISWCQETPKVRQFIVDAYVRGAKVGSAERAELEGSTAVFAKRRFRDRYNRIIVRRVGKERNHTLKVKARVRARGARGQDRESAGRVERGGGVCGAENTMEWECLERGMVHGTARVDSAEEEPHADAVESPDHR